MVVNGLKMGILWEYVVDKLKKLQYMVCIGGILFHIWEFLKTEKGLFFMHRKIKKKNRIRKVLFLFPVCMDFEKREHRREK